MNKTISLLQDIAYNIGYEEGLARAKYLKGIDAKEHTIKQSILTEQWEFYKRKHLNQFSNINCPVIKQLGSVLLKDREKHRDLGLKQCSLNLVNGNF